MNIFEKDTFELMQKYDSLKDYDYEEQEKIINEVRRRNLRTEEEIEAYINSIEIELDIEDFKEYIQEIDENKILKMYENLNLYYREIRELLSKFIIDKGVKTESEIKEKLEKKEEERAIFINRIHNMEEEELDEVCEEMYYYFNDIISIVLDEKNKREGKEKVIKEETEEIEEPEIFLLNGVSVLPEVIEKRNKIRRIGLFIGIIAIYYVAIYYRSGIKNITGDFLSGKNISIILIIFVFSNIVGLLLFKSTREQRKYGVLTNSILLAVTMMSSAMTEVNLEYIKDKFLLANETETVVTEAAVTEEAGNSIEDIEDLSQEDKIKIIEKYKTEEMKEIEKSIKKITEKIAKNSKNSELYFERGELYKKIWEKEKAFEDYSKAIELNENKAKYFIARAECYPKEEYGGEEYKYDSNAKFKIDEFGEEEKEDKEEHNLGEIKEVGFGYGDSENSYFDSELENREEFENSRNHFKHMFVQTNGKEADRD